MNARDIWKTPFYYFLLVAPHPFIGAMAIVGFLSVLVSDGELAPEARLACLYFAAFCYGSALVTALINRRHPRITRWLLCFLFALVVVGGLSGLQEIGFLALLPVPIAVAFLLVGPLAAITVTTVAQRISSSSQLSPSPRRGQPHYRTSCPMAQFSAVGRPVFFRAQDYPNAGHFISHSNSRTYWRKRANAARVRNRSSTKSCTRTDTLT